MIKSRAIQKEKDEKMMHHIISVDLKATAKAEARAQNARRRAAIRRCKKSTKPKHVTVITKRSFWVKEKIHAPHPKAPKPVLKKKCVGKDGKPCFPKTPKKFVGKAMINFGPKYQTWKHKKVAKATHANPCVMPKGKLTKI